MPDGTKPCKPIIRSLPGGGYGTACACGYVDPYVWSYEIGAREDFLAHISQKALDDAGWPGSIDVDYREDDH